MADETKDQKSGPTGLNPFENALSLEQELMQDGFMGEIQPTSTARAVASAPPLQSSPGGPQSAILPPLLGLQTDLASSGRVPGVPSFRLMPVAPAGVSQNNSAAASNIEKNPVVQANTAAAAAAQSTANTALAAAEANTFLGAWNSAVSYIEGNQVTFDGLYYVCTSANTNEEPDISPTFWQVVSSGGNQFEGTFSPTQNYSVGESVLYTPAGQLSASLYICILTPSAGLFPIPTNATYWQIISNSEVYLGAYSGSISYTPGQQVSFTDGNFYICIAATTGNAPSATGSSFWELLGTSAVNVGTWSSTTAYSAGMQVSFTPSGGALNYYLALQASTNQQPGAATTAYWYLIANNTAINSASSYRPTTNPLSATDAGSSATITVASFTMNVAGVGAVSVNGGSLTGLSYGTVYYIYYADPAIAGGSVTFQATTTKSSAISSGVDFFVGSILTPVSGGANTIGNNDGGTGSQTGIAANLLAGVATISANASQWTSFTNINDGNFNSAATCTLSPTKNTSGVTLSGFSGVSPTYTSITLNIKTQVSQNNSVTGVVLQYSLNGGQTFTTVYSTNTTRALTTDSISLPVTQNIGAVQVVMQVLQSTGGGILNTTVEFYEAWIAVAS
jgi:hypothetical protein